MPLTPAQLAEIDRLFAAAMATAARFEALADRLEEREAQQ